MLSWSPLFALSATVGPKQLWIHFLSVEWMNAVWSVRRFMDGIYGLLHPVSPPLLRWSLISEALRLSQRCRYANHSWPMQGGCAVAMARLSIIGRGDFSPWLSSSVLARKQSARCLRGQQPSRCQPWFWLLASDSNSPVWEMTYLMLAIELSF